jgi:hypothetical protein
MMRMKRLGSEWEIKGPEVVSQEVVDNLKQHRWRWVEK